MNMIGLTDDEIKSLIETIEKMKSSKVDNVNNLYDVALLVTSFSNRDLIGMRNFFDTLRLFKEFLKNNVSEEDIKKFKTLKKEVIKNGTNDTSKCRRKFGRICASKTI